MSIPLDLLIDLKSEVYANTCAMVKSAQHITSSGEEVPRQKDEKIVSAAIASILNKDLDYSVPD